MNKTLLALYGLTFNPFSPELPTEALYIGAAVEQQVAGRIQVAAGDGRHVVEADHAVGSPAADEDVAHLVERRLVGHDGKPPPRIAGSSGFDSGIERQQIGLRGDILDNIDKPANFLKLANQVGHHFAGWSGIAANNNFFGIGRF